MARTPDIEELLKSIEDHMPNIVAGANVIGRTKLDKKAIKEAERIRAQYNFKEQRRRGLSSRWQNFKEDKFGDGRRSLAGNLKSAAVDKTIGKLPIIGSVIKAQRKAAMQRADYEEKAYIKFAKQKEDDAERQRKLNEQAANELRAEQRAEALREKLAKERAAERAAIQAERDARKISRQSTNSNDNDNSENLDILEDILSNVKTLNEIQEELNKNQQKLLDSGKSSSVNIDNLAEQIIKESETTRDQNAQQFADTEREEAHTKALARISNNEQASYLQTISEDLKSMMNCMNCQLGGRNEKDSAGGAGGFGLLDMLGGLLGLEGLKKLYEKLGKKSGGPDADIDKTKKEAAEKVAKEKAKKEAAEKVAKEKTAKRAGGEITDEIGEHVGKKTAVKMGAKFLGPAAAVLDVIIENSKELAETGKLDFDSQIKKIKDGVNTLGDSDAEFLTRVGGALDTTSGAIGAGISVATEAIGPEITKAIVQPIDDIKTGIITRNGSTFEEDSPVSGGDPASVVDDVKNDFIEKYNELSSWASSMLGIDSGSKPEPKSEITAKPINVGTVTTEEKTPTTKFDKDPEFKKLVADGVARRIAGGMSSDLALKESIIDISNKIETGELNLGATNRMAPTIAEATEKSQKTDNQNIPIAGTRDVGGDVDGRKNYLIKTPGEFYVSDDGKIARYLRAPSIFTPNKDGEVFNPENQLTTTSNLKDILKQRLDLPSLPGSSSASLGQSMAATASQNPIQGKNGDPFVKSTEQIDRAARRMEDASYQQLSMADKIKTAAGDMLDFGKDILNGDFKAVMGKIEANVVNQFDAAMAVLKDASPDEVQGIIDRVNNDPDGKFKGMQRYLTGNREKDLSKTERIKLIEDNELKTRGEGRAPSLTDEEKLAWTAKFGPVATNENMQQMVTPPTSLTDHINSIQPNVGSTPQLSPDQTDSTSTTLTSYSSSSGTLSGLEANPEYKQIVESRIAQKIAEGENKEDARQDAQLEVKDEISSGKLTLKSMPMMPGMGGAMMSGELMPGETVDTAKELASADQKAEYINQSQYKAQFAGLQPGSEEFNNKWKQLSSSDSNFEQDRRKFIKTKRQKQQGGQPQQQKKSDFINIGSGPVNARPSVAASGPPTVMMAGGGGMSGIGGGGMSGIGGGGMSGIGGGMISGSIPSVGGGMTQSSGPITSTGMPNIVGAPSKMANVIDTDANKTATAVGIDKAHYDTFRGTVAQIESNGRYNIQGGSSGKFDGAYQMGQAAQQDAAKKLGIAMPTREQFRNDPALQEKMFDAYTSQNHSYLMKNEKYAAMSPEKKMEVLGYAHNQGAGGASKYLKTGHAQSDAFGTVATKYSKAISGNYAALDKQGSTPTTSSIQSVTNATSQPSKQPIVGSIASGDANAALGDLSSSRSGKHVDVGNLKSDYATNLSNFRKEAEQSFGKKLSIESGYRPPTEAEKQALGSTGTTQASLQGNGKSGKVASVYGSKHGTGQAADMKFEGMNSINDMNNMSAADREKWVSLAQKHNLDVPLRDKGKNTEWWHVEENGLARGGAKERGQAYTDKIQSQSLKNKAAGGPGAISATQPSNGQLQPQPGQKPGEALAGVQPQSQMDMLAAQTADMDNSQSSMLTAQTADMGGETSLGSGQLSAATSSGTSGAVASAGLAAGGQGGGGMSVPNGAGGGGVTSGQPGIGSMGGAQGGGGTASASSPTETANTDNSVKRINDSMMVYGMA